MKRSLLLLFAGFIINAETKASHIIGGEITWECSGGEYVFTLKLYRDCSGIIFPNVARYIIVTGHPAIDSIMVSPFPGSLTDVSPVGCSVNCDDSIGLGSVEEYIFRSDPVNLGSFTPPPTGWVFSWTLCCRYPGIMNLMNPGSVFLTVRSKMYSFNGAAATPCFDNSPSFAERPTTLFCGNSPSTISNTAADLDFDSLRYEWDQIADVTPNTLVQYSGTFTTGNSFPGNPVLDQHSGVITRSASGQYGDYATCLRVEAYKCDVKVAEIFRDIQLSFVSNCGTIAGGTLNNSPQVELAGGTPVLTLYDTVFAGERISRSILMIDTDIQNNFSVQAIHVDAHGVQLGLNGIDSTSGCLYPPCAFLDNIIPQSFMIFGSYTFQWQTSCVHVRDSCNDATYNFSFLVKDNHCPINAQSAFVYHVVVKGPQVIQQGDSLITNYPGGTVQWFMNGNPVPGATDSIYIVTSPGIYTVQALLDDGCTIMSRDYSFVVTEIATIEKSFKIQPNPSEGIFTINFYSHRATTTNLLITDIAGKPVYKAEIQSVTGDNTLPVDLTAFKAGLYTLIISEGDHRFMRKIIIH